MGNLLQMANAALAETTAASRSFAVDIGTVERWFPSMGEIMSSLLCDSTFTNFPLI
jgi:hypothetical protein